jgi:hypothetical protein
MSSVPQDLITYLDALVAETAGTDLFEGPPLELPVNVVVLTHYGGESALDRVFGPSLTAPGVEVGRVQLFVRNTVMVTAKTRADAIHALLDGFAGTLSGRTYFFISSIDGAPFSIGQDSRGNWRWSCNYRIQYAR